MIRSKLENRHSLLQANSRNLLIALAVIITIQLLPFEGKLVVCQDIEDLNKQSATNNQVPHHTFQLQNKQSVQQNAQVSNRSPIQRPVRSNRFSSASQQQQLLAAQASFSNSVISGPAAGVSAPIPAQPAASASVSNIEQLMKNALARTTQMNSAAAEPRQDIAPPPSAQLEQQQSTVSKANQAQQTASATSSAPDKSVESSDVSGETQPVSADEGDRQTTAAQTTTNGHETVYSDQRFANLFARRNSAKKSRLTPTEQVKAKPTLPSFIKSPPDPKQFSASQTANSDRPAAQSSSNSFASQRLPQNQARNNLVNQQKKANPVITSNSAATANSKRANSLNGRSTPSPTTAALGSKASATNLKANSVTNKPSVAPTSNNPFSRQQSSNADPANVIAMARKRLLANNALETAKLKQQQQNKPT